ncbi:hypothetical protein DFJ74DRAFT_664136 [Hyaloraphidium curvatum]|nr:hypothetical protein DFJ74DRAFT_664136 [Hyaloraphidium curvatum]
MTVVRISKGRYPPALHAKVSAALQASGDILIPAIKKLPGCLSYYAGADEASGTMINASVWDTEEHAKAMAGLKEMAQQAGEFVSLGVEFERPIVNYGVMWDLDGQK